MRALKLALVALLAAATAHAQIATGSAGGVGSATPGTGTGVLVGQNSPTLVTPALGTPSSVNLANGTNLPNAAVVGLGTAATVNTGTSGATLCLANTACTWAGPQTYSLGAGLRIGLSGSVVLSYNGVSTCAATGGTCTATSSSGSASSQVTISSTPSDFTITQTQVALHAWVCDGFDSSNPTTVWLKQIAATTATAKLAFYTAAGATTTAVAGDVLYIKCLPN